eukprot:scaffold629_cov140-Cylindrotheca_fusiformis.AAC.6
MYAKPDRIPEYELNPSLYSGCDHCPHGAQAGARQPVMLGTDSVPVGEQIKILGAPRRLGKQ